MSGSEAAVWFKEFIAGIAPGLVWFLSIYILAYFAIMAVAGFLVYWIVWRRLP